LGKGGEEDVEQRFSPLIHEEVVVFPRKLGDLVVGDAVCSTVETGADQQIQ
jgi:hypothetical protein